MDIGPAIVVFIVTFVLPVGITTYFFGEAYGIEMALFVSFFTIIGLAIYRWIHQGAEEEESDEK